MDDEVILSIDPGKIKCGIAILKLTGEILYHKVVPAGELIPSIEKLVPDYKFHCIVLGDRTCCKKVKASLSSFKSTLGIKCVDEHLTSELARKRYFKDNPPRGLRMLIPTTLQMPPEPYDDYAAIILAERYLKPDDK